MIRPTRSKLDQEESMPNITRDTLEDVSVRVRLARNGHRTLYVDLTGKYSPTYTSEDITGKCLFRSANKEMVMIEFNK